MRATVRAAAAAFALAFGAAVTPAEAQNFDGSHIIKFGVFQQTTFLHMQDRLLPDPAILSANPVDSGTASSLLTGGVSAGIDFYFPNGLLAGFEVDGSLGDARLNLHRSLPTTLATSYGFDYLFNLRGRLGYFARPDLLVYGTAGLSYVGWEAQADRVGAGKAAETVPGFILGVGVEYEWHHVILFADYSHAWYDTRPYSLQFQIGTGPSATTSVDRHIADGEVDAIRVGIKFKVGHDHSGLGRWYDPKPLK